MIRQCYGKDRNGIGFIVSSHIIARDFDDEVIAAKHAPTPKSVDMIFELPDRYYWVELKNPENPRGKAHKDGIKWIKNFMAGLKDEIFCKKFIDTFTYEWEHGNLSKPVLYFVIIAMNDLDKALLLRRNEALSKAKPFKCNCHFKRYLDSWSIHTIETFNTQISDIQLKRLSAAP